MRKWILFFVFQGFIFSSFAQILFTYRKYEVSKQSFIIAFDKNSSSSSNRKKALEEYLQLYINYKLKVQAGYDEKLNETPSFKTESDNYKKQVEEIIINQQIGIENLIKEAFTRSQKDILLEQVFIEFSKDSLNALQEIKKVQQQLQSGKSFESITQQFSTDEAIKKSKGIIGWITAFSLSYNIENIAYSLPINHYSSIYKSRYGYHIFKKINERSAVGKRRIEQILFASPPNATDNEKQKIKLLADSVYQKIQQGVLFETLANTYNINTVKTNSNGLLPDIGIGEYESSFEQKVFELKHPGEISTPFETSYGIHILKLISVVPIDKILNAAVKSGLQQKIESDGRLAIAKQQLLNEWKLKSKNLIKDSTNILQYASAAVRKQVNMQMTEFDDANVLFAAMDKHVWIKATEDSVALQKIYQTNKAKYQWLQGFSGILINCKNKDVIDALTTELKNNWQNWRAVTQKYPSVFADSSRFENHQLPITQAIEQKIGFISSPEKNISDDTYLVLIVTQSHLQKEQKTFTEAKSLVITDLQQQLEKEWLNELKKKYPVKINNAVWKSVQ